jgi:predicted GH43/DUF377 family glycosyl hydrolase
MGIAAFVAILVSGFAAAQTEWVEDQANPVVPTPDLDAWDAEGYVNTMLSVDGTYHLFYQGHEDGSPLLRSYNIGHATSVDGTNWVKDPANPVLIPGGDGAWDDANVASAAVVHDGTEFRMWYVGDNDETGGVGYATSPDGTTWTKYAGNPVMSFGPAGSFDDFGVWPGTVIIDGGTYRMWYTGVQEADDYTWTIGYAESEDGLSWTRHPAPVVEPEEGWNGWLVYAPKVVYDGSTFRMWYAGHSRNWTSIGHAVSNDGIDWIPYWDNPVVYSSSDAIDVSSVIYDDAVGQYRMLATNIIDNNFFGFTSDCCTTVHPLIIPATAYASGAEGSFYETALELSNASATAAEYYFSWLPRGESNGDPLRSETFTLGAGKSVRYQNVLAEIFDLEPDAFGAIRIDSTSNDLMAMARIANTPQEPDAGSFGQAMPAISLGDCTGHNVKRRLLFGTEHADMRYNVGCVNFDSKAARVRFELYRADGTLLGTESLILMPWANDQINRIFDPYHPVTGYVDYWSDAAVGRVYCTGSVLDNVTSDPMTVPPM